MREVKPDNIVDLYYSFIDFAIGNQVNPVTLIVRIVRVVQWQSVVSFSNR